jgi:hypothetical protein
MTAIDDYKLIKLYEDRPLLWDSRLEEYYSGAEKKCQLWKEIADILGSTKGISLLSL